MAAVVSVGAHSGEAAAPEGQLVISSKGKSTHPGGVICAPLRKKAFSSAAMTCSRRKALGKKAITAPAATSHPLRKALGKVNTTTGVMSKVPKRKQENQPRRKQENQSTAIKTNEKTELDSWTSQTDEDLAVCKEDRAEPEEDWPEIENMFPFDPQDFDYYDVPEECKLSHLDLRGVPLMVFPRMYNMCGEEKPTPPSSPELSFSFTSGLLQADADFIASLEKLPFPELPPFPADFYEEQECCNGF